MIEETFTETERQLLLRLAVSEIPEGQIAAPELLRAVSRLSGTDTVLIARRAYPSRADQVDRLIGTGSPAND